MKKIQPFHEIACYSLKKIFHKIRVMAILMTLGLIQLNALGASQTQQLKISGTVTDVTTGQAMAGVNIMIKGTTVGAISDGNGKYSLTAAEPNAILLFSFIGYVIQEVPVAGKNVIDIALMSDVTGLEEVVVIGYGTQKKVSLTGAVGNLDAKGISSRSSTTLQQAVQGKISGLTILDWGGSPGHSNSVMRIRGITTLSNNNPLVIVDGIEQALDYINPSDIESISVLKDASSTAIYGSRAANGVILITTKRAKEGKLSVSFDGYYGFQKYNNLPKHMGLEAYMINQNVSMVAVGKVPKYSDEYIQEYVNATDRLQYPLPNVWFDEVLQMGPQINNNLLLEGGKDEFRVRLNYRNNYNEGIIPNSNSKINEFRINTDSKISEKINIRTDVNYRRKIDFSPVNEGNVFTYLVQRSQWAVPQYPDGTYGLSAEGNNPLVYAKLAGNRREAEDYLCGNATGDWEIMKGLKFTAQFGTRITLGADKSYANNYQIRDYNNPDIIKKNEPISRLTENRFDQREYTINNLLNYSNTFGSHAVNILAGYSQVKSTTRTLMAYRQGFYNNEIQVIGQGSNDPTKNNGGTEYSWALRSYFSRVNYSYKDKYLLEVNGRYDGSSRFMGKNQYSFFPSLAAGWRISKEKFWEGLSPYINELKLRGSWGKTGNQAVALYAFFPTLSLLTYSFEGNAAQGYLQTQMINENLTWETTTQTDIGMDAQFLSNRISLSVDYYNKRTDGILLVLPVPTTLGLNATAQNAGRVDNKGWEFVVESRNTFGQFGFNANLNLSINDNKVVSLAESGPYISGTMQGETMTIIKEGLPITSLWGPRTDGLFQTVEEVQSYPNFRANTKPGDIKYIDKNDDGIIDENDAVYQGPTFPKYIFGSTFDLSFKNFSLNLFFQGTAGVKTRIGGTITDGGIWEGFTHEIFTNNQWTPATPDPNARFPLPRKSDNRNTRMSDWWVWDASYLRLKNARLSYQIPSSLTEKISIKQMFIYVSGTNLLTFSKLNEWNIDPESTVSRIESYGQTSMYIFGVNINF